MQSESPTDPPEEEGVPVAPSGPSLESSASPSVSPPSAQKLTQSKRIHSRMLSEDEKVVILQRIEKHNLTTSRKVACQMEGATEPWFYNWRKRLAHRLESAPPLPSEFSLTPPSSRKEAEMPLDKIPLPQLMEEIGRRCATCLMVVRYGNDADVDQLFTKVKGGPSDRAFFFQHLALTHPQPPTSPVSPNAPAPNSH